MLNSTVVFQLNFSNNISFSASISRTNAKPETVVRNMSKTIIIIGAIIFLILVFTYIQNKRYEKKLRKLNESRPNLTRSEYINRLVKNGFEKKHAEIVYDKIREFIQMDGFSIYPEDDIHKIYRIEDLDDIELIDSICTKLNLRKAEQKDFDELNEKMKIFNADYILTLTKNLMEENTALNNSVCPVGHAPKPNV